MGHAVWIGSMALGVRRTVTSSRTASTLDGRPRPVRATHGDPVASVEPVSTLGALLGGLLLGEPSPPVPPAPGPPSEPFWQRFLTSAGFGGLMALTAALIAARIAALQLRHTKTQLTHERWWSTLTWVYDRAVVEKDKRTALPHPVTFAMLTELAERTEAASADRLQQSTIKAILSIFQASDDVYQPAATGPRVPSDVGDPASRVIRVSDPVAAAMLDELRDKLSSDEELRARTAQITYLHTVKGVVRRVASSLGADASVADGNGHRADFTVVWRGREVLIRVRYVDGPPPGTAVLLAIEDMQTEIAASYPAIGGLIVFNTPFSRDTIESFISAVDSHQIEVVSWRSEKDDSWIRDALVRLRPAEGTGDADS